MGEVTAGPSARNPERRPRGRHRALVAVAREIAGVGTPAEWGARAVAAVESATRWRRVFLFRLDEPARTLHLVAARGITPEQERVSARLGLDGRSLSAMAVNRRQVLVSGRTELPAAQRDNVRALGTPSFVVLPLVARGSVLGTLTLLDTVERAVGDDELEFLRAVGDQLAVGLESARLYEASQARESQAQFLTQIADLFASSLDPSVVLAAIVRRCTGVLGDGIGLFLNPLDPAIDDRYRIGALHHRRPEVVSRLRAALEALPLRSFEGIGRRVIETGQPVLVPDLAAPALSLSAAAQERVRLLGVRSCIVAPLRTRRGPLGLLLSIATAEPDAESAPRPLFGAPVGGPLTEAEVHLATEVCNRAATALENAQLYTAAEAARLWLRSIFNEMVDGVLVLDSDGRVVESNVAAARLFGGDGAQSVTGDTVSDFDLRRPDGSPLPLEERPSALALTRGQPVTNVELVLVRPDGTELELAANSAPLHDASGRLLGVVTVLRDVTAQKRFERSKDNFLSVASHELRTPLTPLKGLTQIMLRLLRNARTAGQPVDIERLDRSLVTMGGQVDRLTGLVNDLLDVSRIKTGRVQLRPQPVDLVALVQDVLERFETVALVDVALPGGARTAASPAGSSPAPRPVPAARTHRISFAPAVRSLFGTWDPARLEQVIANLVANGLKYSPDGGQIVVTLEARPGQDGDDAHLVVTDYGIGIPTAQLADLFQPFVRLSNAPPEHFGGLGLGLYIAYDIVERHGGRIWAESAGQGRGASFHVVLPLRAARNQSAQAS